MTRDDVIAKVKEIEWIAANDEAAHAKQDDLYEGVLTAIANGDARGVVARMLAQEALKVREIEFSRWYS